MNPLWIPSREVVFRVCIVRDVHAKLCASYLAYRDLAPDPRPPPAPPAPWSSPGVPVGLPAGVPAGVMPLSWCPGE